MEQSKPISTPMDKNCMKQLENSTNNSPIIAPYREIIGCLIYLVTCTRPDISFAVSKLSQYLQNPKQCHLVPAKRILRYLSGTKTHGIQYDGLQGLAVAGFSDSDYAGDLKSRKSTEHMSLQFVAGLLAGRARNNHALLHPLVKQSIWYFAQQRRKLCGCLDLFLQFKERKIQNQFPLELKI